MPNRIRNIGVSRHTNKTSRKRIVGTPLHSTLSNSQKHRTSVRHCTLIKRHEHKTPVRHWTQPKPYEYASSLDIRNISPTLSKPKLHYYFHKNTHWLLSCINRIHSNPHTKSPHLCPNIDHRLPFHLRMCSPSSPWRSCSQIKKYCALTGCLLRTPNIKFYFTLRVQFWQKRVGLCSCA